MTKQEMKDQIKAAKKNFKGPIQKVTEESERARLEEMSYTEQSMRDGENGIIRDYHFQDGTTGIFQAGRF